MVRRLGPFLLVAGMMMAACSGDDDTVSPTDETNVDATESTTETTPSTAPPSPTSSTASVDDTTTTAAPETTASTESAPTSADVGDTAPTTTGSTSPDTTAPGDVDVVAAESAWTSLVETTADPADTTDLSTVATPAMADQMRAFFSVAGDGATRVATFPSASVNPNGTISIEDCIWHSPDVNDDPSFHFSATAQPTDAGWQIVAIAPNGPGCVPRELAEPAIAAYDELFALSVELTADPQADRTRLEELATGDALGSFRSYLDSLASAGEVFRTVGEPHSYVSEFPEPAVLVVTNCFVAADGFGTFDADGAPTGVGNVPAGDNYIEELEMERTGDQWKGRSGGAAFDLDCDPTNLPALKQVGP